ncbi:MAG: porphobilinogen synthase [Cohaesibacteraceae bacterium]|nr:porphobilinogen synthase [Cohaesibacteraceae bacterium]
MTSTNGENGAQKTRDIINSVTGHQRMRRNRRTDWSRRLVQENAISVNDLIWPIFIVEGTNVIQPITSMPDVYRYSVDQLPRIANQACELGIPVLALFPYTQAERRDATGSEALNENNLVCSGLRAIRSQSIDIGLMTDVALDPYTSHGHDGLMNGDTILNDETVEQLILQSLLQVDCGSDIIGPSDMMDGRIGAIRRALDADDKEHAQIMAYSAKYASAFYGPFRDAVGTNATLLGDKRTYQMDPANTNEAIREAELDIQEGADMIMVKPGMPYLDIIFRLKQEFGVPTFAYQVSGEYSMICAAAHNGWIDHDRAMLESIMAFKRAGADGVLSYFAPKISQILKNT